MVKNASITGGSHDISGVNGTMQLDKQEKP